MSSVPAASREHVLAGRVRWLDRYRRAVAIASAALLFLFVMHRLDTIVSAEWSNVVGTSISTLCAITAWWVIEVGLAWLTALWETEYDNLLRDRGLPRAEVVRRK